MNITFVNVCDFIGTLAFAISGIRLASAKHFDLFGAYVVGLTTAIGGGTLRDVMLGETPFWMTSALYLICTALAQVFVITFSHSLKRLDNAWFVFDTLGLALFTIAGMQKTLACGHPFWVAVIMGCITGSAGGVIRDILLNKVPVIFHKEIYAMASIAGGVLYLVVIQREIKIVVAAVITFFVICLIRFLAVRYHISLPLLRGEDK